MCVCDRVVFDNVVRVCGTELFVTKLCVCDKVVCVTIFCERVMCL